MRRRFGLCAQGVLARKLKDVLSASRHQWVHVSVPSGYFIQVSTCSGMRALLDMWVEVGSHRKASPRLAVHTTHAEDALRAEEKHKMAVRLKEPSRWHPEQRSGGVFIESTGPR